MSILGDLARENDVEYLVPLISKEIDQNSDKPEVVTVLKKLGRKVLDMLPTVPEWTYKYIEKFKQ